MSVLRLCVAAALLAGLAATPSSTAHAQSWEPTYLPLERLDVRLVRGELIVEYEVSHPAWRRLRESGLAPALAVHILDHGRPHETSPRAIELRRSSARLVFPLDLRRTDPVDEVEISISGRSDRVVIGGFRLGGVSLRRLTVPVAAARPRPRPPRPSTAIAPAPPRPAPFAGLRACGAGLDRDSNESACPRRESRYAQPPPPASR